MAALQDKLPALQKGEFKPRTNDELRMMFRLCKIKKLFSSSSRMYADAFADDPEELWRTVLHRKGGPFEVMIDMPFDPGLN